MNDDLRDQIGRLDPMHPGVPTEEVTAPSSRDLLEHIMSTPTIERPRPAGPRPRRIMYAAAAAGLAAVLAVGSVLVFSGEDAPEAATMELGLGEGPGMASCLAVSADILDDMPVALLGTALAVDGETVTLSVDRWYTGGDTDQVILHAPDGMEALIGGIDFQEGEQYFVAATDGVVNYCGYTDAYSPELAQVYEEAFGA